MHAQKLNKQKHTSIERTNLSVGHGTAHGIAGSVGGREASRVGAAAAATEDDDVDDDDDEDDEADDDEAVVVGGVDVDEDLGERWWWWWWRWWWSLRSCLLSVAYIVEGGSMIVFGSRRATKTNDESTGKRSPLIGRVQFQFGPSPGPH